MGAVVTLMCGVSFPLPNCQGNNCADPQLSRGGLATDVPTVGNFQNETGGLCSWDLACNVWDFKQDFDDVPQRRLCQLVAFGPQVQVFMQHLFFLIGGT